MKARRGLRIIRKAGDDMLLKCVNTGSQNKHVPNMQKRGDSYVLSKTINGKRIYYYSTDLEYLEKCRSELDNGIIPEKRAKGIQCSEQELNKKLSNGEDEWKWIPGYDGLYAISDFGEIVSFSKNVNGRYISTKNKNGWYISFRASDKNGIITTIRVHQAVLKAFVGECPDGYEIHHKDGNKQNNRLDNLEYITPKEHGKHTREQNPHMLDGMIAYNKARYTGKYPRRHLPINKKFPKGNILQLSLDGILICEYPNAKEAERKTGVCSRNILQVANKEEYKPGKTRKQAGGYAWKFEEDMHGL